MKRFTILLTLMFLLAALQNKAQYYEPGQTVSSTKSSGLNISMYTGLDNDRYETMSLGHVLSFAKNPDALSQDLSHLEEETTTKTAGVALYVNLGISPIRNESRNIDREIQVGIGIHSDKEAMVSYKSEDLDTSIVFCNLHSEFTLEGAYLFKGKWGKIVHWHIGLGANGGMTYGNEMILINGGYFEPGAHPSTQPAEEMNMEKFEAKQVYYTRGFIQHGIHLGFGPHWQVGLNMRTGMGLQFIEGADPNFIQKTGSLQSGAKYGF